MPYKTPDLRTAVNRALLFASVARRNFPVILASPDPREYLVCQSDYWRKNAAALLEQRFFLVINLEPDELALFASIRSVASESDALRDAKPSDLTNIGSYVSEINESLNAITSEDI